jgi:hypothetical protein
MNPALAEQKPYTNRTNGKQLQAGSLTSFTSSDKRHDIFVMVSDLFIGGFWLPFFPAVDGMVPADKEHSAFACMFHYPADIGIRVP